MGWVWAVPERMLQGLLGRYSPAYVDTQLLDLNAAGCAVAQTLDRTVTFTQTLDTSNYYVALGKCVLIQPTTKSYRLVHKLQPAK